MAMTDGDGIQNMPKKGIHEFYYPRSLARLVDERVGATCRCGYVV